MTFTTLEKAKDAAAKDMELIATSYKDKGKLTYTAELHCEAVGFVMRKAFFPKSGDALEPTSANFAAMVHALYNHSAWRQKWEKKKLFAKKEARTFETSMDELEEEFGEA